MKRMALIVIMLAFIPAFAGGAAAGEFYQYTDESGNLVFTDDFMKVPEGQRTDVQRYDAVETQYQVYTEMPSEFADPEEPAEKETGYTFETESDTETETESVSSDADSSEPKEATEFIQFNALEGEVMKSDEAAETSGVTEGDVRSEILDRVNEISGGDESAEAVETAAYDQVNAGQAQTKTSISEAAMDTEKAELDDRLKKLQAEKNRLSKLPVHKMNGTQRNVHRAKLKTLNEEIAGYQDDVKKFKEKVVQHNEDLKKDPAQAAETDGGGMDS